MKNRIIALLLLVCVIFCAACQNTDEEVALVSLRIGRAPDKTEYAEGEAFDRSGMTVIGVYSDGVEKEISLYQVDKTTLSQADEYVTVSYKGLSVNQPVTVTGAAFVSSEPDVSSSDPEVSSDIEPVSSEPDVSSAADPVSTEQQGALTVINGPVKTVYVSGESFDTTGVLLAVTDGSGLTVLSSFDYPSSPLSALSTSVTLKSGGLSVDIPVTVVGGTPMSFSADYSESLYNSRIREFASGSCTKSNIDLGLSYAGQKLENTLPDPHKNGVKSFNELVEEIDYHIFYGIDSIVVKMNYDYGDLESTLDRLYFESDLIGGCMSIQGQELSNGYVQVVVKYYGDTLMSAKNGKSAPVYLEFYKTNSDRKSSYKFKKIDKSGISVYNSEQAIYALTHGYKINPVPGSPAQAVIDKAKQILISCCDDSMTEFQKMYNIYLYLISTSVYDAEGEGWAGEVLDYVNASDMFSSRLVSFRAEGPLLYGNSACYGYSKAIALLLSLEGLDVRRVVAAEETVRGRSQCEYDSDTHTYDSAIAVHSYDYVRIGSKDYLIDATYAFAGAAGEPPYTFYRDFCIALTKDQHKLVYKGLRQDKISSSASYRPESFDIYANATYDGVHDCLLDSMDELSAYTDALKAKMTPDQKHYAFCVMIDASGYTGAAAFKSAFLSKISSQINMQGFNYYVNTHEYNGKTYYAAYMLIVTP